MRSLNTLLVLVGFLLAVHDGYSQLATQPASQPTNLAFGTITSSTIDYTFNAVSGVGGYLHIRKAGSAPTFVPVDGTAYAVDQVLSDGSVVQHSDNFPDGQATGLDPNTTYFWKIFAYNGSAATTNYLTTSPLSGSAATLAAEPAGSPTDLTFTGISGTAYSYFFTEPIPAADGYIHIRKEGSAPTEVPQDGVVYTAVQDLGTSKILFVGPGISFSQGSVVAGKTYYYAIYAYNGSGTSINYRTTDPATGSVIPNNYAVEPTSQPTSLSFSNIKSTTFDISFSAAAGSPDGYIGVASTGTPGVPVDGTTYTNGDPLGTGFVSFVGPETLLSVTGADPATTLNYAIYSYNGTGSSINYRQLAPLVGFVTTLSNDDQTPPVLKSNTTLTKISPGQTLKITTTWEDQESGVSSVEASYGPTNQADWDVTGEGLTNTSGNTWELTIPVSSIGEQGVEYRLIAYNGSGYYFETNIFRVVVEHTGVGLVIPYSAYGSSETSYRIISIPLVLEKKSVNDIFSSKLGAYDPKKWRLFRYQGGYKELTGTSTIDLGRGYMFIAKENKGVLNTGAGVTANFGFDTPFTITPSNGWNLIGNPFNFNVVWADVQAENASLATVPLKVFTGTGTTFSNGTTLASFSGGFIFVNSTTPITIPHVKSGRRAEPKPELNLALDQEQWQVEIKVASGDLHATGGVGMSTRASVDYDQLDDFTLPRFHEYVELNHDKTLFGSPYAKDIVPTTNSYEWTFDVETNGAADIVKLEWDNSYFGTNDRQLVLWDETQQRAINMRDQSSYSFRRAESSRFKVLFGSPDFVREKAKPNRVVLHQIYPVPADRQVTFAFSVPESQETTQTTLDVYDLVGKKIATLVNAPLKGGYHEVTWQIDQGQKPLAGIYVSVLRHGNAVAQDKLILK